MSGVLARICADKLEQVAAARQARPIAALMAAAATVSPVRGFQAALRQRLETAAFALITELKRASPSRGLIRADFDPVALASAYVAGGATCLSVLTESRYFQGRGDYLTAVRAVVPVPLLCKDFFLDPYQVVEARVLGADCVLLILAAVDDGRASELVAAAADYGLDVLVEVHDEAELDRAIALGTAMIGINNRNLSTLAVDLAVTERLAPRVPADRLLIGESGIVGHEDLLRLRRSGVRSFLIGETLMRQVDVGAAVRRLLTAASPTTGS